MENTSYNEIKNKAKTSLILRKTIIYILLIIWAIVIIFPFYWSIILVLK